MERGALLTVFALDDLQTKSWIISAIAKLVAQTGLYPDNVRNTIHDFRSSLSVDVQQVIDKLMSMWAYVCGSSLCGRLEMYRARTARSESVPYADGVSIGR